MSELFSEKEIFLKKLIHFKNKQNYLAMLNKVKRNLTGSSRAKLSDRQINK